MEHRRGVNYEKEDSLGVGAGGMWMHVSLFHAHNTESNNRVRVGSQYI